MKPARCARMAVFSNPPGGRANGAICTISHKSLVYAKIILLSKFGGLGFCFTRMAEGQSLEVVKMTPGGPNFSACAAPIATISGKTARSGTCPYIVFFHSGGMEDKSEHMLNFETVYSTASDSRKILRIRKGKFHIFFMYKLFLENLVSRFTNKICIT